MPAKPASSIKTVALLRPVPAEREAPLAQTVGAKRCRRKFLAFFPKGFADRDYVASERTYKWEAHLAWNAALAQPKFEALLKRRAHAEIAGAAVRIESRTNLLFSFEKMALRDAVRSEAGAQAFATGLYDFLHGGGAAQDRLAHWIAAIETLPRKQTRVLTWPLVTVFGFIAQPRLHIFLKPNVTRDAARQYGFDFAYKSRPQWETYASLLDFARTIRTDQAILMPRDMIDIQSFIWVQGSEEYD